MSLLTLIVLLLSFLFMGLGFLVPTAWVIASLLLLCGLVAADLGLDEDTRLFRG